MSTRRNISLIAAICILVVTPSASAQVNQCLAQANRQCRMSAARFLPAYQFRAYQQCMAQAQARCVPRRPVRPPTAAADPRIVQMVQRIMETMCPSRNCGRVQVVSNQRERQAASARTDGMGLTILSYSPQSMNTVVRQFGPNAILGIMAHEIGHHFDFNGSPWAARMRTVSDRELRADWFAGCTLARMRAESGSLSRALQAMGRFPTHGYPHGHQRVTAVQQGYAQCGGHSWPTSSSPF